MPNYTEIFSNLPVLTTERLLLRPLRMSDAEDIFAYGSIPDVSRYTTWEPHADIEATRGFLSFVLGRYASGQPESWGMELRDTGRMIGTVGLLNFDEAARRIELGYTIHPDYQGRGLVTEGARAALDFAFDILQVNRVVACCMGPNAASERVIQKLGLRYEGCFREHYYKRGVAQDLKFYGLLARERTQSAT